MRGDRSGRQRVGQVTLIGRWHLLVVREEMFPWPFDEVFKETLYPVCGSLTADRPYFSQNPVLNVTFGQPDCKKCLKQCASPKERS